MTSSKWTDNFHSLPSLRCHSPQEKTLISLPAGATLPGQMLEPQALGHRPLTRLPAVSPYQNSLGPKFHILDTPATPTNHRPYHRAGPLLVLEKHRGESCL